MKTLKILQKLKHRLTYFGGYLFSIGKPINKKIIFESFSGKQYSDNPRAICEKMHELYPDYELVFALREIEDKYAIIPDYVRCIKISSINFYRELSTSCCYVTNCPVGSSIYKRKGQFFIQTWHGDRVPKKVLYDADPTCEVMEPICDNKMVDLCIAASDIGEKVYRSAFRFSGDVMKVGMPRNDKLIKNDPTEKKQILRKINLQKDNTKFVLYAPTFRDNQKEIQQSDVNIKNILKVLNEEDENWKCLVRAHSASKGLNIMFDENIIDVSDYPDMADILLITDLLITDYSSSPGDFILMNKPVVLTLFDEEDYIKNCRGLAFRPEKVGFFAATKEEELYNLLRNLDAKKVKENCDYIKEYFNIVESGNSAEKICIQIAEQYKNYKKIEMFDRWDDKKK